MLGKRRPARQRSGVSGLHKRSGEAPSVVSRAEDAAVVIERLAHDGRGVARSASGKTLFIDGALPGERIEVAVHRTRKRFDEAHVRVLLEPSAERVEPPCVHYGQCGGCDLQHLDVEAQREHKRSVLVDLLAREGIELSEPPRLLTERPLGYRRRARLGVKVDAQGVVHLGFRARHASRLVDIQVCEVLLPELSTLIGPLRELLAELEAPRLVGHLELIAADSIRVVVVRQLRDNRADLQRWREFGEANGVAVARLLGREETTLEWLGETPALSYRLPVGEGELELGFAPGDFVQVNERINRELVATVREWLGRGTCWTCSPVSAISACRWRPTAPGSRQWRATPPWSLVSRTMPTPTGSASRHARPTSTTGRPWRNSSHGYRPKRWYWTRRVMVPMPFVVP